MGLVNSYAKAAVRPRVNGTQELENFAAVRQDDLLLVSLGRGLRLAPTIVDRKFFGLFASRRGRR